MPWEAAAAIAAAARSPAACAIHCKTAQAQIISRDRHLLSLQDMNRSAHLHALLQAGISSFKIEGRLKNIDYVMNVVAFYRRELDRLLDGDTFKRASSGTSIAGFTPAPAKSFNRGFTDFFIRPDTRMASMDSPKSRGEPIGHVTECNSVSFALDRPMMLSAGDGVCFLDPAEGLQGTRIRSVEYGRAYPEHMHSIAPGTAMYRNLDRAFQNALKQAKPIRTLAIECVFQETPGGFRLSAQDEDGVSAQAILTDSPQSGREAGASPANHSAANDKIRGNRIQLRWS